MKISWTPRAIEDYSKILAYLYETWGAGSVKKFTAQFENTLKSIEKNPGMFRISVSEREAGNKIFNPAKQIPENV